MNKFKQKYFNILIAQIKSALLLITMKLCVNKNQDSKINFDKLLNLVNIQLFLPVIIFMI